MFGSIWMVRPQGAGKHANMNLVLGACVGPLLVLLFELRNINK